MSELRRHLEGVLGALAVTPERLFVSPADQTELGPQVFGVPVKVDQDLCMGQVDWCGLHFGHGKRGRFALLRGKTGSPREWRAHVAAMDRNVPFLRPDG